MIKLFEQIGEFLNGSHPRPLLAIIGPTASGKTALSLKLAKKFNGEIISADSRQIYKFMDIGTDKILPPSKQGITHHMLDLVDPDEEFTLADFKRLALKTIDEIYRRHKLPILVGGTGLYFNAIIDNYDIPRVPPNHELRAQLAQYHEQNGTEALHQMLAERDPQTAKAIHPHNVRYVIRALEINLAGNMLKTDRKAEPQFNVFTIGIDWPREILYGRINRRVDLQIEKGLVNEVKTLLAQGYNEKLPAMSSLGYPEIIAYIQGKCTLEAASYTIKKNTRNYCKRQLTWFRRNRSIHWIDGPELEKFCADS